MWWSSAGFFVFLVTTSAVTLAQRGSRRYEDTQNEEESTSQPRRSYSELKRDVQFDVRDEDPLTSRSSTRHLKTRGILDADVFTTIERVRSRSRRVEDAVGAPSGSDEIRTSGRGRVAKQFKLQEETEVATENWSQLRSRNEAAVTRGGPRFSSRNVEVEQRASGRNRDVSRGRVQGREEVGRSRGREEAGKSRGRDGIERSRTEGARGRSSWREEKAGTRLSNAGKEEAIGSRPSGIGREEINAKRKISRANLETPSKEEQQPPSTIRRRTSVKEEAATLRPNSRESGSSRFSGREEKKESIGSRRGSETGAELETTRGNYRENSRRRERKQEVREETETGRAADKTASNRRSNEDLTRGRNIRTRVVENTRQPSREINNNRGTDKSIFDSTSRFKSRSKTLNTEEENVRSSQRGQANDKPKGRSRHLESPSRNKAAEEEKALSKENPPVTEALPVGSTIPVEQQVPEVVETSSPSDVSAFPEASSPLAETFSSLPELPSEKPSTERASRFRNRNSQRKISQQQPSLLDLSTASSQDGLTSKRHRFQGLAAERREYNDRSSTKNPSSFNPQRNLRKSLRSGKPPPLLDYPIEKPEVEKPNQKESTGRNRGSVKSSKSELHGVPEKSKSSPNDEVKEDDNYPEVYKQLKKAGRGPKEILALLKARKTMREAQEKTNNVYQQPTLRQKDENKRILQEPIEIRETTIGPPSEAFVSPTVELLLSSSRERSGRNQPNQELIGKEFGREGEGLNRQKSSYAPRSRLNDYNKFKSRTTEASLSTTDNSPPELHPRVEPPYVKTNRIIKGKLPTARTVFKSRNNDPISSRSSTFKSRQSSKYSRTRTPHSPPKKSFKTPSTVQPPSLSRFRARKATLAKIIGDPDDLKVDGSESNGLGKVIERNGNSVFPERDMDSIPSETEHSSVILEDEVNMDKIKRKDDRRYFGQGSHIQRVPPKIKSKKGNSRPSRTKPALLEVSTEIAFNSNELTTVIEFESVRPPTTEKVQVSEPTKVDEDIAKNGYMDSENLGKKTEEFRSLKTEKSVPPEDIPEEVLSITNNTPTSSQRPTSTMEEQLSSIEKISTENVLISSSIDASEEILTSTEKPARASSILTIKKPTTTIASSSTTTKPTITIGSTLTTNKPTITIGSTSTTNEPTITIGSTSTTNEPYSKSTIKNTTTMKPSTIKKSTSTTTKKPTTTPKKPTSTTTKKPTTTPKKPTSTTTKKPTTTPKKPTSTTTKKPTTTPKKPTSTTKKPTTTPKKSTSTTTKKPTTTPKKSTTFKPSSILSTTKIPTTSENPREIIDNEILAGKARLNEDYVVYGLLPNNSLVRRRVTTAAPAFIVYGLYPNGTIVRRYPNGTILPEDDMDELVASVTPGDRDTLEELVRKDSPLSYLYPLPTPVTSTLSTSQTYSSTESSTRVSVIQKIPATSKFSSTTSSTTLKTKAKENKNAEREKSAKVKASSKPETTSSSTPATTSSSTNPTSKPKPSTMKTTPKPKPTTTTIKTTPKPKPTTTTIKTTQKPKPTTIKTTPKPKPTTTTIKTTPKPKPATTTIKTTPKPKPTTTTIKTTQKPKPTTIKTTPKPKPTTTTIKTTPKPKITTVLTSQKTYTVASTTLATAIQKTSNKKQNKKNKTTERNLQQTSTSTEPDGELESLFRIASTLTTSTPLTTKTSITTKSGSKRKSKTKTTTQRAPSTADDIALLNSILLSEGLGGPSTTNQESLANQVIQLAIERAQKTTSSTPSLSVEDNLQALPSSTVSVESQNDISQSSTPSENKDAGKTGKISVWVVPTNEPSSTPSELSEADIQILNALFSSPNPSQGLSPRDQLLLQSAGPENQGRLVQAAISVTRAVSQFMGVVITGAAQTFQSFLATRTRALADALAYPPPGVGN